MLFNGRELGRNMIEGISLNIVSDIIWLVIGVIGSNYKRIFLLICTIFYWGRDIRFSIAYLYKIKIDDKYLLIKGGRIDQFQPVGGVYKVYDSFKAIERDLDIRFENEAGFYEDGDLRFYVKGKNINKVLKWFNSRKNREISAYREFYEEIIKNNILPEKVLQDIKIEFLKQIKPKMTYSKHFKKNEILIFDIFEIYLSNEYQDMIQEYSDKQSNDLIILTNLDDIEKECTLINGKSRKIGAHSKYIL